MQRAKRAQKRGHTWFFIITAVFLLLVLGIAVFMNIKNTSELREILTDSIESQLISISVAAREVLDLEAFESYNSPEAIAEDQDRYDDTLGHLRNLAEKVGALYIYALKQIDGQYYFIFDTDVEGEWDIYDLAKVHENAFLGKDSAGVLNVTDEYGSYNTGAVPIWKDGKILGIISTDLEDTYLKQSNATANRNAVTLIVILAITMTIMLIAVFVLLRRVYEMRARLEHIAHYDAVTGLPNRQFLLEHLASITRSKEREPFALLFIDLDNFKKVNDSAGHDAGDELLRSIAQYLQAMQSAIAFRPSAGILNIAARIGGDEFIQIVSGIGNEAEAVAYTDKLFEVFNTQLRSRYIDKYGVGMSIGIALYPFHSENFHVLIKYADIAMYHAKNAGKNCFRVYNDEMQPAPEK